MEHRANLCSVFEDEGSSSSVEGNMVSQSLSGVRSSYEFFRTWGPPVLFVVYLESQEVL